MSFRPMLSPREDPLSFPKYWSLLQYPLLCSPKLDGIRCATVEFACKSRTLIDLPSKQVQEVFSIMAGLDGELIEGEETDFDVYNRTQSYVMSGDKPSGDLKFRVFDSLEDLSAPFEIRLDRARELVETYSQCFPGNISLIEHQMINNMDELLAYEDDQLALGYEGIMMRTPHGIYKTKTQRCTFREGIIYKLKRFEDVEMQVVRFEEQMHNTNPDIRSNTDTAKRSQAKEGLVPAGMVGRIIGRLPGGREVDVAPGHMKHKERKAIWDNNRGASLHGMWFKTRHFPHGAKDMLRQPRFVGWRHPSDML